MKAFILLAVSIWSVPAVGIAATAASQELAPLHVESFLTPSGGSATDILVSLRGEGVASLLTGDLLVSERPVLDQTVGRVRFTTGHLKVAKVDGARALATIQADGAAGSSRVLRHFNKVMAGDMVRAVAVAIKPALAITPEVTIDYNTLFADPNAGSVVLEMSPSGREALAAAVESMGSVRTGMVSVEGYTDPSGDSESNQVESYERAMTARRFLVESLGFDPDRVKAFGMGEQEPVDTSNLSGSVERNRRIVIKVIPESLNALGL